MTVRDFLNYLIYVEHAAENLQFFLWYQDYVKRFSSAPTSDLALAPEWTQTMQEEAIAKIRKENADKMRSDPEAANIFKGTEFEKQPAEKAVVVTEGDPFDTPPQTASFNDSASLQRPVSTIMSTHHSQAADAFQAAGAKQPCMYL